MTPAGWSPGYDDDADDDPPGPTPYERARARVEASPDLAPLAAFILADWPEGDEHYTWAATAPLAEVYAWAVARQHAQD